MLARRATVREKYAEGKERKKETVKKHISRAQAWREFALFFSPEFTSFESRTRAYFLYLLAAYPNGTDVLFFYCPHGMSATPLPLSIKELSHDKHGSHICSSAAI